MYTSELAGHQNRIVFLRYNLDLSRVFGVVDTPVHNHAKPSNNAWSPLTIRGVYGFLILIHKFKDFGVHKVTAGIKIKMLNDGIKIFRSEPSAADLDVEQNKFHRFWTELVSLCSGRHTLTKKQNLFLVIEILFKDL